MHDWTALALSQTADGLRKLLDRRRCRQIRWRGSFQEEGLLVLSPVKIATGPACLERLAQSLRGPVPSRHGPGEAQHRRSLDGPFLRRFAVE